MATFDSKKLPPQSIEAEMSILGGILLENEAINRVLDVLVPEDFYRETHRKIMRAMIELNEHREPCDLITLTTMLKKRGDLEEVGGGAYLATLVDFVPTAANIAYYSKIVKEKAILRTLILQQQRSSPRAMTSRLRSNSCWTMPRKTSSIFRKTN